MNVPEGVSAVKIVGQSGLFGTGITLGNALIGGSVPGRGVGSGPG